jgi:hypothetical protein
MCPACVASAAAWIVGGTMSTGGVTALAVRILGNKKRSSQHDSIERSEEHVRNQERDTRGTDEQRSGR